MSVQEDSPTRQMRTGGWLPTQRTQAEPGYPEPDHLETDTAHPARSNPAHPDPVVLESAAPDEDRSDGIAPHPVEHAYPSPAHAASPQVGITPIAPDPDWSVDGETVLLPAFLTGAPRHEPTPSEAPPATPTPPIPVAPPAPPVPPPPVAKPERFGLPSSERNMLIFVSALLAAGTLAIVAMMSLGALSSHKGSAGALPSASASAPTPAPSVSGRLLIGLPDPARYCGALPGASSPSPPGPTSTMWACGDPSAANAVTFTPTMVCKAQYGSHAIALYDRLNNPITWGCYR